VTLVFNDWSAAQVLICEGHAERVGRLVLCSCEAFDNLRTVESKEQLLEWAERQRVFDRPVLVVWAAEDRVMPPEHGPRLADLFPRGGLVEISDSYTLIPEDQSAKLAAQIREFVSTEVVTPA
jgi:pimeloyl-ACP methyl ester carboxylesterase